MKGKQCNTAGFLSFWQAFREVRGLHSFSQPARQHVRKTGGQNASLGLRYIVFHAALVVHHAVFVKHAVGGAGIAVSGLAYGAHINQIFIGFE